METFKTNVPSVFFHQMKGDAQPEKCKPSLSIFFNTENEQFPIFVMFYIKFRTVRILIHYLITQRNVKVKPSQL